MYMCLYWAGKADMLECGLKDIWKMTYRMEKLVCSVDMDNLIDIKEKINQSQFYINHHMDRITMSRIACKRKYYSP